MAPSRSAGPASGTHRLAGLDALRGLAAAAIVVLHVWLYTTTTSADRSGFAEAVVHELRLALTLFFVLSGFLIYRAWVAHLLDGRSRPALRRYASARVRRLVPGAWACLAVSVPALVALDHVRGVQVPDAGLLPLFAVFAQGLHPETVARLNPPMWTLTVEATFYLLVPALGALAVALVTRVPALRSRGRVALLVPALVLALAGTAFNVWLLSRPPSLVLASALPALAPCFAAGMAAAALAHGRTAGRGAAWVLLAGGAALVGLNGWWHESGLASGSDAGRVVRDAPAAVGFALVLTAVAHGPRPSRVLSWRPFTWLGERSYGVYLWHMPVIFLLRAGGVFPEGRLLPALLVVALVVLPVAHLSWTLVERPALRWRRRPAPRPVGTRPPVPQRAGRARPASAARPKPALAGQSVTERW